MVAEGRGGKEQLPQNSADLPGVHGHDEQDFCWQACLQNLHCRHQVSPLVHPEPSRQTQGMHLVELQVTLVLLKDVVAVPACTAMLAKDCVCSVIVSVDRDACTLSGREKD